MESRDFSRFTNAVQTLFRQHDRASATRTLEQSNVDLTERLFGAVARGDVDEFLDCVTDDVDIEISAPVRFPWKRRAKGRAQLQALVEQNFAALADQQPAMTELVAQGNVVVVLARETGRVRSTAALYDVQFVYVFTFRDGKVHRIREVVGEASA